MPFWTSSQGYLRPRATTPPPPRSPSNNKAGWKEKGGAHHHKRENSSNNSSHINRRNHHQQQQQQWQYREQRGFFNHNIADMILWITSIGRQHPSSTALRLSQSTPGTATTITPISWIKGWTPRACILTKYWLGVLLAWVLWDPLPSPLQHWGLWQEQQPPRH